jgi:alkylation response protein AidB-like acyl-CoA dehydrogenase
MARPYTDDQAMLANTARGFLRERAPVSRTRALRDAGDPTGFAPGLWTQFAEMGFNGILIDEALGGLGLGHVEAGILLEEIGCVRAGLAASPRARLSPRSRSTRMPSTARNASRWARSGRTTATG